MKIVIGDLVEIGQSGSDNYDFGIVVSITGKDAEVNWKTRGLDNIKLNKVKKIVLKWPEDWGSICQWAVFWKKYKYIFSEHKLRVEIYPPEIHLVRYGGRLVEGYVEFYGELINIPFRPGVLIGKCSLKDEYWIIIKEYVDNFVAFYYTFGTDLE